AGSLLADTLEAAGRLVLGCRIPSLDEGRGWGGESVTPFRELTGPRGVHAHGHGGVRGDLGPLAVLLEQERHASGLALMSQRARPVRMHRARVVPALAAGDDPIDRPLVSLGGAV